MLEFKIDFEIDIEVRCQRCGKDLSNYSCFHSNNGVYGIVVFPCPRCLEDKNHEGYEVGYSDAMDYVDSKQE